MTGTAKCIKGIAKCITTAVLLLGCATVPPPEPVGPEVCTHGGECESVRQRCRELAADFDFVDYEQCVKEANP